MISGFSLEKKGKNKKWWVKGAEKSLNISTLH